MTRPTNVESLLESLCELTVIYILALQAIGIANLALGKPLFNTLTVLVTTAVVIAGWFAYRRPRMPVGVLAELPLRVPFAILLCAYCLFLLDVLISYPTGYDAVAYHLLKPISWIRPVTVPLTDTIWQMALPANAELFTLPAIVVNAQNLVVFGNVAATAILGLSVWMLAHRLSGSREGAALSSIILLSIPIVIFQTFTLHVDVFGTAFLLAAIALFFRFQDSGRIWSLILSVLCAGVSIGTKQIFVPYAALLLLFMVAALAKRRKFLLIPALLLATAAPSTLWVCRNWVSTGNPFYPFPVRLGIVAFPGAYNFPPKLNPSVSKLVTRHISGVPVSEFFGIGAPFATFGAAGTVAMILETIRRRRSDMMVLLAVLACAGAFWWIAIYVVRFALPLLAAVAIFCALLCVRLSEEQAVIARALLTVGVLFCCLTCVSVPLNRLSNRIRGHDWSRAAFYGYPRLLDQLPPGTSVLDHTGHYGFVLSGRNLQNRVFSLGTPLTPADLSRSKIQYIVKDGYLDAEDRMLSQRCDIVYDGVPISIFPKTATDWRVYQVR